MALLRSALLCFFITALCACGGHIKPVARPAKQNAESAAMLLHAMHFDVLVTQLVERIEDTTRVKMAAFVEKQPLNAEQRRLFDEMTEQLFGVIHFEYSWGHFGPIVAGTIQASFSQEDIDALLNIFESPAGRDAAAQLELSAQDLLPSFDRQNMAETLEKGVASRISPETRKTFTVFAKTTTGQDVVARMPAWQVRLQEEVTAADAARRIQALQDEYKLRIRAAGTAR